MSLFHNFHLLIDAYSLGIGAIALSFFGTSMWKATRKRAAAATACGITFTVLLMAFFAYSVLASPSVWPVILAAYVKAPPEQQIVRKQEIADSWLVFEEQIRVFDWYFMAQRWNVCHELWQQRDCTKTSPHREAQGVARELLTEIAK